jgi:small nuclear ribonucleoprotein
MVLPLDVLQKSVNKRMQILLKDGRTLTGDFVGYDQYMNLVLEDVEERMGEGARRLGTIVLRGNNVVSMGTESAP